METFLRVMYILLGIVPLAIVRYMPFYNELRLKKWLMWLIFGALTAVEAWIFLQADTLGYIGEQIHRLYYIVYLLYSCATIKTHPARHLLVWLLSFVFRSLGISLGILMESVFPDAPPFLVYDLTMLVLTPLYIWGGAVFSRRVITPLVHQANLFDCILFDLMLALAGVMGILSVSPDRIWMGVEMASTAVKLCLAGVAMLACVIFYRITAAHQRVLTLQQEGTRKEQLLSVEREQYQRLSQSIESARVARHDLRHHLTAIGLFCEQEDREGLQKYLSELNAALPLEQLPYFCENATINAILAHYQELARKDGITTDIQISIKAELCLSDSELWVMLGNLLDNAIEGVKRVPQENRTIRLRMRQQGRVLGVTVDNPCDEGALRLKDGWYLSTKASPNSGMGLKSILYLAQAHDGNATFEVKQGWFRASVDVSGKPKAWPPEHSEV